MNRHAGRSRSPKLRAALVPLAAALATLAGCGGSSGDKAISADDFVDSIGVNVHMSYTDTAYRNTRGIIDTLRELGVRYVRDGVVIHRKDQYAALQDMASAGIHADLILGDPLGRFGSGTIEDQLAVLHQDLAGVAESVEGPNEFDVSGGPNSLPTLRRYQATLYERVKQDPALAGLTVIAPSLVDLSNWAQLGDIERDFDFGNLHAYPGGGPVTPGLLQSQADTVRPTFHSKPIVVTETGYHNSLKPPPGQQPGVSEAGAAIYVPRLFLEHFRFGIARTYLYELADEKPEPAGLDPEQHFGLVRSDLSRKPAFFALRNMIALLKDPGSRFDPGRLDFDVRAPQPVSRLLLQKRNGRFYLVLWRSDAPAFSSDRRPNVQPPSITAEVTFAGDAPSRVVSFAPVHSPRPVRAWEGQSTVKLSLGSEPLILEVEP